MGAPSSNPPEPIVITLGVVSGVLFICLLVLYKIFNGRQSRRASHKELSSSKFDLLPTNNQPKPSKPRAPPKRPRGPRPDPNLSFSEASRSSVFSRSRESRDSRVREDGRRGRPSPWSVRGWQADIGGSRGMPCDWPEDERPRRQGPSLAAKRAMERWEMMERLAMEEAMGGAYFSGPESVRRPPRARRGPRYTRHFRNE